MNKAVSKLLAVAIALVATHNENAELQAGIEALKALGENATHSNSEYTSLKTITDAIEVADGKDGDGAEKDTEEPTRTPKAQKPKAQKPKAQKDEDEDVKYKMDGIRMIGSKYYSAKDGYKKGFGTAQECAKKFNEPKKPKE